jgi:hypothetical protein
LAIRDASGHSTSHDSIRRLRPVALEGPASALERPLPSTGRGGVPRNLHLRAIRAQTPQLQRKVMHVVYFGAITAGAGQIALSCRSTGPPHACGGHSTIQSA